MTAGGFVSPQTFVRVQRSNDALLYGNPFPYPFQSWLMAHYLPLMRPAHVIG